ncbi:uncharacterized protein LOC121369303 [Gigantopelta aegis]|uniref:uncharacterized protein LOC121369303 n=1 Tax=Gigantopelta aegis TaxID=1735272 RepID=UPI001B88AABF|nr:uncharacterized protein LOC121369303 [Gigantopelta aegis]XP_041350206.1 uncharacterized protein LOC121369303 [Gigantopelta aegis]
MDERSKKKRRRSIRNLRRQSIIFGSGNDDIVTLGNENIASTTEDEYGSLWVDSEVFVPATKCSRSLSMSSHSCTVQSEVEHITNGFTSQTSISGPPGDLSPIELARFPSNNLSPKVMTPYNMFTNIKCLEEQTPGVNSDSVHVIKQNGHSLDAAFLSDTVCITPNSDPIYKPSSTCTSSSEGLLHRDLSSLSRTVKCSPSSDLSPMFSPVTPNIRYTDTSMHELSNGIPELQVTPYESPGDQHNLTEPTDKDTLYTALSTGQSELYDGNTNEMNKKSKKSVPSDNIPSVNTHINKLKTQDANDVLQINVDSDDGQTVMVTVQLTDRPCTLPTSCTRLSTKCSGSSGDSRAVNTSNNKHKSVVARDTQSFDAAEKNDLRFSQQESSAANIEYNGVFDNNSNIEWNPEDEIFYTPKAAKSPSRLQAKRLVTGAAQFIQTIATKLSKEKKNRRKSNFLFEGISAPLLKSPKETPVISVESVKKSYCTQEEKENNCPHSFFISVNECSNNAKPVSVSQSIEVKNTSYTSNMSGLLIVNNESGAALINSGSDSPQIVETVDQETDGSWSKPCVVGDSGLTKHLERVSSVSETINDVDYTDCTMAEANNSCKSDSLQQMRNRGLHRSADFTHVTERDTCGDLTIDQTDCTVVDSDNSNKPHSSKIGRSSRPHRSSDGILTERDDLSVDQTDCTVVDSDNSNKPHSSQQASASRNRRRRKSANFTIATECYASYDLSVDQTDCTVVDSDNSDKPDCSLQASASRNRRRRRSANFNRVTECDASYNLTVDQTDCTVADSHNSDKPDSSLQVSATRNVRGRKSANFILATECDASVDHVAEEVSYIRRRSRRHSFEMCRQQSKQKFNYLCSDLTDDSTDDADVQICSGLANNSEPKPQKVRRYRKKNENLEDLYRNKNFKMPDKKTWETIFEVPHDGTLVSKKKQNRILLFENVPPAKKKRRQQKAAKLGWDVTGRKRVKMSDDYVRDFISAISQDLACMDCV